MPFGGVSAELLERRLKAVAAMQQIGREIAQRGHPLTTEEIVEWVREGREERDERIWSAATGQGR